MSETALHFGKYQLLDRIAAGGMAEIFKARYSPAPGVVKQVVIKKILPHYAENKGFIAMFTNEARIAMGLSHGNIAQVFDFGAIDGDYFLAMELVDGQPLSKVLKRARAMGLTALPPEFAAYIASEMLRGLHYAHTRLDERGRALQIVHRDVSPQNVLISFEAQVKLVDFGIARARNAGVEESNAAGVKGKYAYFAPEQARGKDLDARTDVFAAGIVLYEMLTGQLPFQGRMVDVLSRIVRGQFPRPREVNRSVPAELERIVLKAMALDRNDRYPTAEAFHQDLSKYLAQAHPEFSAVELALLLQLLFEEELVGASRPTQLPPDFLERAARWKTDQHSSTAEGAPTEMVELGDEPLPPPLASPSPPARERPGFPVGRAIVLGVVAVGVGFLAVLLASSLRKASLEITSTPPGASVSLDGRALPGVTPLVVRDLEPDHQYRVEVRLAGFVTWSTEVGPKPGQHLVASAPLAKAAPTPPAGLRLQVVELPAVAREPDHVSWPVSLVTLNVAQHHLELNAAGATVVPLDPSRIYRIALSKGPTPGWGFYVVNDAGATPVAWADQPIQVKGASKLLAFHLPLSLMGLRSREESKPRVLQVLATTEQQASDWAQAVTHEVPSALTVPPTSHVTVTGLDPTASYELTPRAALPQPRIHPHSPVLQRLLVITHEGLQVVPFGVATRFTNTEQLSLMVVDDAGEPSGRVEVELNEVPKPTRR